MLKCQCFGWRGVKVFEEDRVLERLFGCRRMLWMMMRWS